MPKAVFDAQVSFAMLPKYGEEAPVRWKKRSCASSGTWRRCWTCRATAKACRMPSLRLIQAPVFHGYSFSAWVEFEGNPGVEALESGLQMESIDVRGAEFEPPNNVGQAGQSGIAVGAILAGPQRSRRPSGSGSSRTTCGWPRKTRWRSRADGGLL